MMVKICGITNTADAFAAIGCGAGALGFNFWPRSRRYIRPDDAVALLDRLPGGCLKIGLFVNEPPDRILEVARRLSLDAVQVHGDRPLPKGVPVWKALSVTPGFKPRDLDRYAAEVFVLDAPAGKSYGGTGKTFDWSLVAGIRKRECLPGVWMPRMYARPFASLVPGVWTPVRGSRWRRGRRTTPRWRRSSKLP